MRCLLASRGDVVLVYPRCVGCGQRVPWSLIYWRGGAWACACCAPKGQPQAA